MLPPEIEKLRHDHQYHECEGAKFHSPRPLHTHPVTITDTKIAYLCGTCRDNLSVFVQLWERESGLEWSIQRLFGNQIRALAQLIVMSRRTHRG